MKIKYYKYLTVLLIGASLFSCSDYLDINQNPNQIQEEDINPRLRLPGALANSYRVQARTMNLLGNRMMQNWGFDVNNVTGTATLEDYTLQLTNNFYDAIWDGLYPGVYNFQRIIDFQDETYDNHKGVAYIMKSFYMQYLVDLYGDVPYSQAFQGQNNLTPGYDDDKAIYRDLITNIDKALVLFEEADDADEGLGVSDIVFNGDINNWVKFANTLKIRILLRQTELADVDGETQSYLVTEFAKVEALGQYLDVSATINPGYSDATAAQLNPFYSQFVTATGTNTQVYNQTKATDYVADFLNGALNGVADPRAGALYTLVEDPDNPGEMIVSGAVQGETEGPDEMSFLGTGIIVSADQDGYIMTLAEAKFLMAEAIERGYLPGNAQAEFDAGVTASFLTLGLTATDAASYLIQANTVSGLGWNGNHIESIMTQKWLAVNGINAIESWIDYTRTGFPNVPLATTALYPNRPYRLLYPTSELVANSANVPGLSISQIFVQGPFWKI